MSRSTLYVIADGLVCNGRSYQRGDEIAGLDEATEAQLRDEDRISTTEPREPALAAADPAAAPAVTIADFSDEDLLAEVSARDLEPEADDAPLTAEEIEAKVADASDEERDALVEHYRLVATVLEQEGLIEPTKPAEPEPTDYSKLKVADLEKLIEGRQKALEVKPTGENDKVVKDDLVTTLQSSDAAE